MEEDGCFISIRRKAKKIMERYLEWVQLQFNSLVSTEVYQERDATCSLPNGVFQESILIESSFETQSTLQVLQAFRYMLQPFWRKSAQDLNIFRPAVSSETSSHEDLCCCVCVSFQAVKSRPSKVDDVLFGQKRTPQYIQYSLRNNTLQEIAICSTSDLWHCNEWLMHMETSKTGELIERYIEFYTRT